MQMGYRRGGWYGYDWIDNDSIPSTVQVLPEWQHLKVGDTVPVWRNLDFPVVALEAKQYFVFASPNKHDRMAKPYAAGLAYSPGSLQLCVSVDPGATLYGSVVLVAVRQNLRGIKARAEGRRPQPERTVYTELLMWVACFVFLAVEIVLLVPG